MEQATNSFVQIKRTSLNFIKAMKIRDNPGIYCTSGQDARSYKSYSTVYIFDLFCGLDNVSAQWDVQANWIRIIIVKDFYKTV